MLVLFHSMLCYCRFVNVLYQVWAGEPTSTLGQFHFSFVFFNGRVYFSSCLHCTPWKLRRRCYICYFLYAKFTFSFKVYKFSWSSVKRIMVVFPLYFTRILMIFYDIFLYTEILCFLNLFFLCWSLAFLFSCASLVHLTFLNTHFGYPHLFNFVLMCSCSVWLSYCGFSSGLVMYWSHLKLWWGGLRGA